MALETIVGHRPREPDNKFRFRSFGRVSISRHGSVDTFYSQTYAVQQKSHKKNSYCVCFRSPKGQQSYGRVLHWYLDEHETKHQLFALIDVFGGQGIEVNTHPTIPGAKYFPREVKLAQHFVPAEDVLFKCIFHDMPHLTVQGVPVFVMMLHVHRVVDAYDDTEDAADFAVMQDELF